MTNWLFIGHLLFYVTLFFITHIVKFIAITQKSGGKFLLIF